MQVCREAYDRRESKMLGTTFAGLEFDSELAGPDGCAVTLFVPEGTPRETVEKAKSAARTAWDVVRFYEVKIPADWVGDDAFRPGEPRGWIEAARWIRKHHSARRVEPKTGDLIPEGKSGGVLLDAFSASAMVQVYDALNEKNQAKFGAMPLVVAHKITFELIKKKG